MILARYKYLSIAFKSAETFERSWWSRLRRHLLTVRTPRRGNLYRQEFRPVFIWRIPRSVAAWRRAHLITRWLLAVLTMISWPRVSGASLRCWALPGFQNVKACMLFKMYDLIYCRWRLSYLNRRRAMSILEPCFIGFRGLLCLSLYHAKLHYFEHIPND